MSSRGSVIKNGHITTSEYKTNKVTSHGVKILEGYGNNHSLPDYAHTPNSIYAKLKKDKKTLHEMRFYDEKGYPIIEIAYHPEPPINNGSKAPVVHFHMLDERLNRYYKDTIKNHPDIKEKYLDYLKEFDLYDKC